MIVTDVPRRHVSAIIPTRNRAALLAKALASVRALEGPDLAIEIIVVDNGSTDATADVARAAGAVLVHAAERGASAARNAGIRAATGAYIAFLDDDDAWLPGHLRPHLALLEARPDFDAVVGQTVTCDSHLRPRHAPWPQELPADGDVFEAFLGFYPQVGATVVRASAIDELGLFDEALLSDEDWDWHLRLALYHRVGFVAEPCVLFRQRPAGTHDDLQWQRHPNLRRVFIRNLRRAGMHRVARPAILRAYLRHSGAYFAYFAESALVHAAAGDQRAARRSLGRAVRTSPLHAVRHVARGGTFRSALHLVMNEPPRERQAS